jgi:hypothetical protein
MLGGMPVQARACPVVAHGGARVGMGGGLLPVPRPLRRAQMLDAAGDRAVGRLSAGQDEHGDAVLIMDETADEKPSDSCAGASRQYSGTVGGIALC